MPLRSEIFETKSAMDTSKSPFCDLYLTNILGRRAFDSTSNLFYDYDDRIIYIAGCNFVITSFQDVEEEGKYNNNNNNISLFHKILFFLRKIGKNKKRLPYY